MASHSTSDHDEIRRWAGAHAANPSVVSRTGGMLRFEFAPDSPALAADVDWNDFFRIFDERGLELVYDDQPGSRFHKLVYPESAASKSPARRTTRAKIQPIRTRPRASTAKPRVTRTGTKALGRSKSAARRRPKAA